MNHINRFLVICLFCISSSTIAQGDLTGTWEGILAVTPDQQIDVQFIFARNDDGTYSALLNAPDQPSLNNIPVDTVTIDQNNLSMSVSAVSGEYQGTLGESSINGTWSQQGTSFELNLAPYVEPVLDREGFNRIAGSWIGTLRPVPGGELEFSVIVRIEENETGEFVGFLSVPEQGGNNIPVDTIELDGDELTIEISQAQAEITGMLDGESFSGSWNQVGQSLELNLEKGEYEVPGLEIAAEDFAAIEGTWTGQIGPLNVVFRFIESDDGFLAFLDSPDQGATDIPINTLSVQGNQLNLEMAALAASYSAIIGAEEISGSWSQAGQTMTLTLSRGDYLPFATLSDQARERLNGEWHGTVNDTDLIFRFENTGDEFTAVLDIPSLNTNNVPVSNISLNGENLEFTVPGIGAEYSATGNGNEYSGDWSRAGNSNSLTLTRQ